MEAVTPPHLVGRGLGVLAVLGEWESRVGLGVAGFDGVPVVEHFPGSVSPTVLGQQRTRDPGYPPGSSLQKWAQLSGESGETSVGVCFPGGSDRTPTVSHRPLLWGRVSPQVSCGL